MLQASKLVCSLYVPLWQNSRWLLTVWHPLESVWINQSETTLLAFKEVKVWCTPHLPSLSTVYSHIWKGAAHTTNVLPHMCFQCACTWNATCFFSPLYLYTIPGDTTVVYDGYWACLLSAHQLQHLLLHLFVPQYFVSWTGQLCCTWAYVGWNAAAFQCTYHCHMENALCNCADFFSRLLNVPSTGKMYHRHGSSQTFWLAVSLRHKLQFKVGISSSHSV